VTDQALQELFEHAGREFQAGRLEEAERLFRQIAAERPREATVLVNLGSVLHVRGRFDEAAEIIRQAIALRPDFPEAWFNLGLALELSGKLPQAVEAFRRYQRLRPDDVSMVLRIGNHLFALGRLDESATAYRQALAIDPNNAGAWYNLGNVLRRLEQLDETVACLRQAVALKNDFADAWNNLGATLKDLGLLDESIGAHDRAYAADPNKADLDSNRLYTLHFHPDFGPESLLSEHLLWSRRHAEQFSRPAASHDNSRSPDRPLRIGYVSAELRQHPVGLAIEPILTHHDRKNFYIVCFSNDPEDDAVTRRIRNQVDEFIYINGQSDDDVAKLIREKKIDILVDLSLHMAHNRLLVFARKPAPVQVTYLGYPSTTGVSTIDYRISDIYLDPPQGGTDRFYTEKTIRLPRNYLCWRWGGEEEPVGPLPALANGFITFGSLNNFCKVTPQVLDTWGELMSRVSDSRLVLRCPPGSASQRVLAALARHGIAPQRIELAGRGSWKEYAGMYRRQDIGLDPFPYPGHTTSLDGLWMGVPVVTLAGKTCVSRAGAGLMNYIRLPELIATSTEQYIRIAQDLSNDLPRLARIRAELRQRILDSPLSDARQFTRDIETTVYRRIWKDWCAGKR
jgi:protein O-GlcNAc transferase